MYITNIPFDPSKLTDDGIVLADILEEDGVSNPMMTNKNGKSHCLTARYNGAVWWNSIERKQRTMVQIGETAEIKGFDILKRVYSPSGKSPTLTTMQGGHREPKIATYNPKGGRIINRRLDANGVRKDYQLEIPFTEKIEVRDDNKTNCLTTIQKDNIVVDDDGLRWRKLLPTECESLQTLPRDYTSWGSYKLGDNWIHRKPVAKSNRYKAIGNGWTVSIINEIFKGIDGDLRDVLSLFDGISCGQQALKTTERS
jgi:site-specific DNA-cytosine methylase